MYLGFYKDIFYICNCFIKVTFFIEILWAHLKTAFFQNYSYNSYNRKRFYPNTLCPQGNIQKTAF
jgi:hypothetical protein